jgi:hypothetical protein
MSDAEKKNAEKKIEIPATTIPENANPLSAWPMLPEKKSLQQQRQPRFTIQGQEYSLAQLRGKKPKKGEKVDAALIQSLLNQPAYPGYPSLGEIYSAAINRGESICSSDHPLLMAEYDGYYWMTYNMLGSAGAADGRSLFGKGSDVLASEPLEKSRKQLTIEQIVADKNKFLPLGGGCIQEYCFSIEEEQELLQQLGQGWKIEKFTDAGNKQPVAVLYDSNKFNLLECHFNKHDTGWKRVRLTLQETAERGKIFIVHGAWVSYDLTVDEVRKGMTDFSKEKPTVVPDGAACGHVFLMDLNKDGPAPNGPAQLVLHTYRQTDSNQSIVGIADTDIIAVADDKGIRALKPISRSPAKRETKQEESKAVIPPAVKTELARPRGWVPFTSEFQQLEPKKGVKLVDYQQELRLLTGVGSLNTLPGGNRNNQQWFLQIRMCADDNQYKGETFYYFLQAFIDFIKSCGIQNSDTISYERVKEGNKEYYHINVQENASLLLIQSYIDNYKSFSDHVTALSRKFPNIKVFLNFNKNRGFYLSFEAANNKDSFLSKQEIYSSLSQYRWKSPLIVKGDKLTDESLGKHFKEVGEVLVRLFPAEVQIKDGIARKKTITPISLQDEWRMATGDENLTVSFCPKLDAKEATVSVKVSCSYGAKYIATILKDPSKKEFFHSGIINMPLSKVSAVSKALSEFKSATANLAGEQDAPAQQFSTVEKTVNAALVNVDDSQEAIKVKHVDEQGVWVNYKPGVHEYFLGVLKHILGGEQLKTAIYHTDDLSLVCIPAEKIYDFITKLPTFYPAIEGARLFDLENEFSSQLEDEGLVIRRVLQNGVCKYEISLSVDTFSQITKIDLSPVGAIVQDDKGIVQIRQDFSKCIGGMIALDKDQVLSATKLKRIIPDVPAENVGVSLSVVDAGKAVVMLPRFAAEYLAQQLGGKLKAAIEIVPDTDLVKIHFLKDQIPIFCDFLQESFGDKATVKIEGTTGEFLLGDYRKQLKELTGNDPETNIIKFLNLEGKVCYRMNLSDPRVIQYLQKQVGVKSPTPRQIDFVADDLARVDVAIRKYYEMVIFKPLQADAAGLKVTQYKSRLGKAGITVASVGLIFTDVAKSEQKSASSGALAAGKQEPQVIMTFSQQDKFRYEFIANFFSRVTNYPVRIQRDLCTVTVPLDAMQAFDRFIHNYVMPLKNSDESVVSFMVNTLLKSQAIDKQDMGASAPKKDDAKESKRAAPLSKVQINAQHIVRYLLQQNCSLNIETFWAAVSAQKGKPEAVRELINEGTKALVDNGQAALIEQAEMIDTICNPQSPIHKLLASVSVEGQEVDYIQYWQLRQKSIHKQRSAVRLAEILGKANDEDEVNKLSLRLDNETGEFVPDSKEQGLSAEQIKLRRRYNFLQGASAAATQLRSKLFTEDSPNAAAEFLTQGDIGKLVEESAKAAAALYEKLDNKQTVSAVLDDENISEVMSLICKKYLIDQSREDNAKGTINLGRTLGDVNIAFFKESTPDNYVIVAVVMNPKPELTELVFNPADMTVSLNGVKKKLIDFIVSNKLCFLKGDGSDYLSHKDAVADFKKYAPSRKLSAGSRTDHGTATSGQPSRELVPVSSVAISPEQGPPNSRPKASSVSGPVNVENKSMEGNRGAVEQKPLTAGQAWGRYLVSDQDIGRVGVQVSEKLSLLKATEEGAEEDAKASEASRVGVAYIKKAAKEGMYAFVVHFSDKDGEELPTRFNPQTLEMGAAGKDLIAYIRANSVYFLSADGSKFVSPEKACADFQKAAEQLKQEEQSQRRQSGDSSTFFSARRQSNAGVAGTSLAQSVNTDIRSSSENQGQIAPPPIPAAPPRKPAPLLRFSSQVGEASTSVVSTVSSGQADHMQQPQSGAGLK